MTVSNTSPLVENKTGNGVWTTIAVTPGQILQNSDGTHAIKVIKTTIADGTAVTLAETTDYTVTLDGTSPSTGTITIVAGAPSSSYRFTVLSNLTPKQEVNLQNGTIVDMEDIESALDRLTLYAHKQDEKLERAVVLSEDTLVRNLTIDSLNSQTGKVLRVNADEDGFDYVDVTEGISQATFDINALSAIDSVVTSTDKLPIYDVSTGATKYVTPDNLGLGINQSAHGNIQQIQYANKTDTQDIVVAAGGTWYDVTGLSITITPSKKDSKLIIGGFINLDGAFTGASVRLVMGDSIISPTTNLTGVATAGHVYATLNLVGQITVPFLVVADAGTTSSQTIKVQVTGDGAATLYINKDDTDTNSASFTRTASHLYVMEMLQNASATTEYARIQYKIDDLNTVRTGSYIDTSLKTIGSPAGSLMISPISTSSYNLLLGNLILTPSAAIGYEGNIFKNGTELYSASSVGSKKSICFACTNTVSTTHNLTFASLEAISSVSTSLYDIRLCENQAGTGATTITCMNGINLTQTAVTNLKGISSLLGINFITSGSSTWKQAQVTSLSTTATATATGAGTFLDPSLSVSITPTSASNYLWVNMNIIVSRDDNATSVGSVIKIQRDGTNTLVGDAGGSRTVSTARLNCAADNIFSGVTLSFILPATSTSATTIKALTANDDSSTSDHYVNKTLTDTDTVNWSRGVSQISVIEIGPIA